MPEMMYHRCFCHYYEGRFSELCVCDNSFSKWPPEALIFAEKNGTHFFFTRSWSKNNFKPKNQFQQANPTGDQNLTLWPLLYRIEEEIFRKLILLHILEENVSAK